MRRRFAIEEQLATVPLFAHFSAAQLQRVSRLAVRVREPKGTELVREGERGNEFLVILDGTVEVRHADQLVATLGPGAHLGEIALVDDRARRTATVVAITTVTVAYLGRREFAQLLSESPEFTNAILSAMASRITDLESHTT
jgi:CRP-like cAMP-binding protein